MSNLRERAREIREAGEEARSTLKPPAAPMKIYNYWLEHSGSTHARRVQAGMRKETFCGFFWATVLFGPSLAVGRFIKRHDALIGGTAALGALAFLVYFCMASPTVLDGVKIIGMVAAGLASTIFGILLGVSAALPEDTRVSEGLDWKWYTYAAAWLLAPVQTFLAFVITKSVRFYMNHLTPYNVQISIAIVATFVIGFLGFVAAVDGFIMVLAVLGITLGTITALAGGAYALSWAADAHSAKLRRKADEAYEARLEANRNRSYEDFREESNTEPREPGMISKGFTAALDFLVLVFQMVRVKKWKTCPFIDVGVSRQQNPTYTSSESRVDIVW